MNENRSTLRQNPWEINLKSFEHPGENSVNFQGEREGEGEKETEKSNHKIPQTKARPMQKNHNEEARFKRNSNTGS